MIAVLAIAASGGAVHDALAPQGPAARWISGAFWTYLTIAVVVFVLVVLGLLAALLRRRRPDEGVAPQVALPPSARVPAHAPLDAPDPARERRHHLWISVATGVTVVILFALLVQSIGVGRALEDLGRPAALTIDVVGHRWWWEVRYPDPQAYRIATTANEIHIPVGKPVELVLESRDVIHSFWVPSLNGKADLIPGERAKLVIQADRPGVYRGQCAEFCGFAHAKMGFLVIAEEEPKFQAWLDRQRAPAAQPASDRARRGQETFLESACAMCHTVRGTGAAASTGPDLTHVGGRLTLGAGTIPNVRGHLAGWIANSQTVKPGNDMPPVGLTPEELDDVVTFLEGLE